MPRLFLPNDAFVDEIESEGDYQDGVREIAEKVKSGAEANARSIGAPWMERDGHELIEVGEDDEGTYVANTDHGGHLQEYGSVKNSPHAPLRRAAQAAGLRVDESQ